MGVRRRGEGARGRYRERDGRRRAGTAGGGPRAAKSAAACGGACSAQNGAGRVVRGWRWWRVSFATARGAERAGAMDRYETRAEPPVGPRIAGLRPRRRWYRPPWRPQRHRGCPVALGPNARPRWRWRAAGSFGRSWGPERRVATRAAPEARHGTSGRVVRPARRRREIWICHHGHDRVTDRVAFCTTDLARKNCHVCTKI